MRLFKKLLVLVFLLLLLIYCVLFAVNNAQNVPVDLIIWDEQNIPVFLLSLGLLVLGFVLGSLTGFLGLISKNLKIKRLKRQLDSLQKHTTG